MKSIYIYMLTNKYITTFYIGVTANLSKRLEEHYDETASKFTKKYNTKDLIYFEEFSDIE
ncbi:MAG: GIY-YIG nuclease family protein [Algibacter sp.]